VGTEARRQYIADAFIDYALQGALCLSWRSSRPVERKIHFQQAYLSPPVLLTARRSAASSRRDRLTSNYCPKSLTPRISAVVPDPPESLLPQDKEEMLSAGLICTGRFHTTISDIEERARRL